MATSQIPANQIGADFAAPTLVDISELRSAGAVFVSRYLSTAKNHWKVITAGERDAIWGAGLGILLNWEVSTTSWERPGDGTAHAQQAAQQAASLGYPTNLPIIASIDDDVERAQIEIAAEYLTNFRGALGAYPLGIYGAAPIANQVNDLASFVWATESTAWGTNYHRTPNLQQHSISKFPAFERFRTSNGEPTIDINVTLTAIDVWTSGQDSLMPSPPPTAPPSATPAPHPSAYTVQRGDTLTKIAADHHTTVANLLRANPAISDPNRIMVGQVIKLP